MGDDRKKSMNEWREESRGGEEVSSAVVERDGDGQGRSSHDCR